MRILASRPKTIAVSKPGQGLHTFLAAVKDLWVELTSLVLFGSELIFQHAVVWLKFQSFLKLDCIDELLTRRGCLQ